MPGNGISLILANNKWPSIKHQCQSSQDRTSLQITYWIDFFDEEHSPVCCYYAVEEYSFLFLFRILLWYCDFVILRPWDHQAHWNTNGMPRGFWSGCNYSSWCNIPDMFKLILNYNSYWFLSFAYRCLLSRMGLGYVSRLELFLPCCMCLCSFPSVLGRHVLLACYFYIWFFFHDSHLLDFILKCIRFLISLVMLMAVISCSE